MIPIEKLPVFYIPHGGGPWHAMGDESGDPAGYEKLRVYLANLGKTYKKNIKNILVVSAHWEETVPTIYCEKNPRLYYDYYGFPPSTYHLKWSASGNPTLEVRVDELLRNNGFATQRDTERGYDHGAFVPLMVAFPKAQIPVIQLSLMHGLDPQQHIEMGKALEPLRSEGVLIIGSGMSYHNMRGFMSGNNDITAVSKKFDDWLTGTVMLQDSIERNNALIHWHQAPGARECHPRSEHLVPLFLIAGAAGNDAGQHDYSEILMDVAISGYKFG
ncbi:DODA-type extradiol aromatic ring-opening family dioxygenase [Microbacter margulisiae]|uniref:Aromatic ring-opening dioxygenase catalytic subunit (LigB family) n=1 Tax=Microbacter margulisiae TaxID=1350067 RepID=A0A7W5DP91_9PORP|nr:class III extradiol ring-cleavage dioxygenase [Microbacter margulisiae]MBB3186472.1 aromatic ring-opening dioxygenase catalytic subunit (LigB family) [Microbacter margulisiae]